MQHLKGTFQLSTPYWMGQKGMQYFKQVAKLIQNKEIVLQLLPKMRHTLKSAAEKSEKFVPVRNKKFSANHRHSLCLKH